MNIKKIASFRRQLTDILEDLELQDNQGAASQKTVELDQQSIGRLSRMDAMQHQAMALATQMRRDQMKTRIAAAFARIDEGEFGYCVGCGEEIAAKRLEFDPAVPNCVGCARG